MLLRYNQGNQRQRHLLGKLIQLLFSGKSGEVNIHYYKLRNMYYYLCAQIWWRNHRSKTDRSHYQVEYLPRPNRHIKSITWPTTPIFHVDHVIEHTKWLCLSRDQLDQLQRITSSATPSYQAGHVIAQTCSSIRSRDSLDLLIKCHVTDQLFISSSSALSRDRPHLPWRVSSLYRGCLFWQSVSRNEGICCVNEDGTMT